MIQSEQFQSGMARAAGEGLARLKPEARFKISLNLDKGRKKEK